MPGDPMALSSGCVRIRETMDVATPPPCILERYETTRFTDVCLVTISK